jgi:hypothetical protein
MTIAIRNPMKALLIGLLGIAAALISAPGMAAGAPAPVTEILSSHIGWNVNATSGQAVCTIASHDQCQPGERGTQAGGFDDPAGVSATATGDVYVADSQNERVQELSPAGDFVSMFGEDVDKTKVKEAEKGAAVTQAEENVCTALSKDECQAGTEGAAPGQFGFPQSIAVDPTSQSVYVAEVVFGESGHQTTFGERVQGFAASGAFLFEVGKEVNQTTKANLCTEKEVEEKGVKCGGPAQRPLGSPESVGDEPGVFAFGGLGNMLAAGGPEHLLYVGDAGRVQEFKEDGTFKRDLSLASISAPSESHVAALTVDGAGDLFIVYQVESTRNTIREFMPAGTEVKDGYFPLTLASRDPNATAGEFRIDALAIDQSGRLAVSESEKIEELEPSFKERVIDFGSLIDTTGERLISEFKLPEVSNALAFGNNKELYAVSDQEVLGYEQLPVGELRIGGSHCVPGALSATDVTFTCTLEGQVNPWEVPQTQAWFQWGTTPALGSQTPKQAIGEVTGVSAPIESLYPDETYYYRLAAEDQSVKSPELFTSQAESVKTEPVPPRIVGRVGASFITSFSAVLRGRLNPENTSTEYSFEYGPCQSLATCQGSTYPMRSVVRESEAYGGIGAIVEIGGLHAATPYHYRLSAKNGQGEAAVNENGESTLPEGAFTTISVALPQAQTGAASDIGVTTATISGSVDPDGLPATYAFELGLYNGAATYYGVVFSGSTGAGTAPIPETLALFGLQPGTQYAYRIKLESGYGQAVGAPASFTTAGLPSVLVVAPAPAMLAVPPVSFPHAPAKPTCKSGYRREKRGRCVKVIRRKKAKAGKKAKKGRKSTRRR